MPRPPAFKRVWAGILVAFSAAFLIHFPGPAAQSQALVDLELVLAVDVSGSVDDDEYALQMGGIANAFRSPVVLDAIRTFAPNGLAVAVTVWSSSDAQSVAVDWTLVSGQDDAAAFAELVEAAPRGSRGNTAIGSAIAHATRLFDGSGFEGRRQVIDISGDGISNDGPDIAPAREIALQRGITINGLVIVENNLVANRLYRREVVGGPGAFVIAAQGFKDFEQAFLRKLLREIQGLGIS